MVPRSLDAIRDQLRQFASDREWNQFHTPKNLASAVSVEAGELLERFLWCADTTSPIESSKLEAIGDEMADVLLYLVMLADALGVDLLTAAERKLEKNAAKYPVALAKGSSKKYTEFRK